MKNIIFDLGGVLFARNPHKTTDDFKSFFSFIADKQMPHFWEEYDRGTQSLDETIVTLAEIKNMPVEVCRAYVQDAIDMQEEIAPTATLVEELHQRGYRLYVLSNMSREFIDFLRLRPIYAAFDGEVVSCEEGVVKPEEAIYRLLLERYNLVAEESLFIDDRAANVAQAQALGIHSHLFIKAQAQQSCDAIRDLLYK